MEAGPGSHGKRDVLRGELVRAGAGQVPATGAVQREAPREVGVEWGGPGEFCFLGSRELAEAQTGVRAPWRFKYCWG